MPRSCLDIGLSTFENFLFVTKIKCHLDIELNVVYTSVTHLNPDWVYFKWSLVAPFCNSYRRANRRSPSTFPMHLRPEYCPWIVYEAPGTSGVPPPLQGHFSSTVPLVHGNFKCTVISTHWQSFFRQTCRCWAQSGPFTLQLSASSSSWSFPSRWTCLQCG